VVRAQSSSERIATFVAVSGIVLLVALVFKVRSSGLELGDEPRTAEEQRALLASGECALGPSNALMGKVIGPVGPGRSLPHGGYLLQGVDRPRVLQVDANDVTVVPCTSVRR
jgi:hypothetical protein